MNAQSQFRDSLARIFAPALRDAGFSRKGKTFYLGAENNWGIVEFQKSLKSTADEVLFTINLGIVSGRLLAFYSSSELGQPILDQSHWRQRIGALLPHPEDRWWSIGAQADLDEWAKEPKDLLVKVGIPAVRANMRDEKLRDNWLNGVAPGLTNVQRLMHLSVLLCAIGPRDQLEGTLREMERISAGRSTAPIVKSHIRQLQHWKGNATQAARR